MNFKSHEIDIRPIQLGRRWREPLYVEICERQQSGGPRPSAHGRIAAAHASLLDSVSIVERYGEF